jgi:hypothetical protein
MNGFVYMEFYDVTWVVYYGFFITDVPWWIRYLDFTVVPILGGHLAN